jgi:hypothetical protein
MPKLRVLNYAATYGLEPGEMTWAEVKDLLQSQLSDPKTRALTAIEQLGSLVQGEQESVMDFLDRWEKIEVDLPQESEISRIGNLFPKFRPDIRFLLTAGGNLPETRAQLVSAARRLEGALKTREQTTGGNPPMVTHPVHAPRGTKRPAEDPAASEQRQRLCFNCGKPGHFAIACTMPRQPQELRRCYACGEVGHISTNCLNVVCRNCGEKGHTAVRCSRASASGVNVTGIRPKDG